jgi:hypothetical protein
MREYSVVARLNPSGLTGIAGPGLKEEPDSRLTGLEETWIRHEDRRTLQCNDSSIEKSRAATTSYPQFPWSHFLLADCLRKRGDQAWRGHAEKAIQIFEHTTLL